MFANAETTTTDGSAEGSKLELGEDCEAVGAAALGADELDADAPGCEEPGVEHPTTIKQATTKVIAGETRLTRRC